MHSVTGARWTVDDTGAWLMLKVASINDAKTLASQVKPGKEYSVDLRPLRKSRSLNANAYMWQLCTQLAEVNSLTKEEVYRNAVKDVGVYKDFLELSEQDASTIRTAWEMLGTGWVTEQVDYMPDGSKVHIRCYYGSSTYNTKQMSRLIDYIVQDCKACGIETLTDAELSLLIEQHEEVKNGKE